MRRGEARWEEAENEEDEEDEGMVWELGTGAIPSSGLRDRKSVV